MSTEFAELAQRYVTLHRAVEECREELAMMEQELAEIRTKMAGVPLPGMESLGGLPHGVTRRSKAAPVQTGPKLTVAEAIEVHLKANGIASIKDIVHETGRPRNTINTVMARLFKEDRVERVGRGQYRWAETNTETESDSEAATGLQWADD